MCVNMSRASARAHTHTHTQYHIKKKKVQCLYDLSPPRGWQNVPQHTLLDRQARSKCHCTVNKAGAATSIKIMFVAANKCFSQKNLSRQIFVATNIFLLRQNFCRDKHTFVATKDVFFQKTCFVATKIILVAAPANDSLLLACLSEWSYMAKGERSTRLFHNQC